MTRFLDRFSVLLLDMNGTFMFGQDRFGPEEDYAATYRALCARGLGERTLDDARVQRILQRTIRGLLRDYEIEERCDDFPTVAEGLRAYGGAPEDQLVLLEEVFAAHEMGYVPAEHEGFLRSVAGTHHLGIVSNLCARPEPWLRLFRRTGLLPLFRTLAFSSEGRSIKPSRLFFERVLATLPSRDGVLFVGDSLERDVVPAKAMGLATAWIAPRGSEHPAADVVVPSLPKLGELGEG